MALEEHHLLDARAEAESKFSREEIESSRPLLDAFQFHILELMHRAVSSSLGYYEKRQKKIDKAMGDIDYDLGEDGEEK